jgi:hypothetical protein
MMSTFQVCDFRAKLIGGVTCHFVSRELSDYIYASKAKSPLMEYPTLRNKHYILVDRHYNSIVTF